MKNLTRAVLSAVALASMSMGSQAGKLSHQNPHTDQLKETRGVAVATQPADDRDMGGGFIEYLATGQAQRSELPRIEEITGSTSAQPRRPRQAPVETRASVEPSAPAIHDPLPLQGSGSDLPSWLNPQPQATVQPQPQVQQPQLQPSWAPAPVQQQAQQPLPQAFDPRYERQIVEYTGRYGPGTIVVDTDDRFLYLVQSGGKAVRYGVGVGRPGFEWSGMKQISAKQVWPDWRPPEQMLRRRPELPRFMQGGPENPLGARAMYLGSSMYRIHGSNEPHTIGQAVSSGCIRMRNEDVMDLYDRVHVGTRVIVM